MAFDNILIANRGEIAVRIARAASSLGLGSVSVYSQDDASALHVRAADRALGLPGMGPRAYLDGPSLVRTALDAGCQAIHPGYGFLSESAVFARLCAVHDLVFIGPSPEALALFGDKTVARRLAKSCGIPVAEGADHPLSLNQAEALFASFKGGPMMLKAAAGGGGRGIRLVRHADQLKQAYERCRSEALAGFGDDAVYAERVIEPARHIEIQVLADHKGGVIALGDRDCSLQRRRQKLIEITPSPGLSTPLRSALVTAALTLARAADYSSLGTFEFLVEVNDQDPSFVFMEANARIQVEHTITEEVTGVDLVEAQIEIAQGRSLTDLGLAKTPAVNGHAIQMRVNTETVDPAGSLKASSGVLSTFEPPSGPGVRVDAAGYAGYAINPAFDSLLAKVIVRSAAGGYPEALRRGVRALEEFRVSGVETNIDLLLALLRRREIQDGALTTTLVEDKLADLLENQAEGQARYFPLASQRVPTGSGRLASVTPEGTLALPAPTQGLVIALSVRPGDLVRPGQTAAILESMKMEHLAQVVSGGVVHSLAAEVGQVIAEGEPLLFISPADLEAVEGVTESVDLDAIRPDLAEALSRVRLGLDQARPEAVAKRRKLKMRTARENVNAIVDEGSLIEYGALAIAAQRRRRTVEDLMINTPADGLITGIGSVNGALVEEIRARCAVLAYDYTVLAGTQGSLNHKKTDRIMDVIERESLPVIWFAEGGGGRPGDTDGIGATGLDVPTFEAFARLSGLAPRIGVVSGRCFAGNAVFFGCCDVTIATKNASIGMAGPAMIEGGGLGVHHPDDVGPIEVQTQNGVVDLVAEDEVEAAALAKRVLHYFQGAAKDWNAADQRLLRRAIPENRLRVYDIRALISLLVDEGSFLELRSAFGRGMITGLIRMEGRPMGLIANDPRHLGGAIDSDGATKAARFMQLCDAFGLPMLSLCDTPGFMVGPESEKTAPVRHGSRMFIVSAQLSVPIFAVVLRKGYGLGAQAMTGGSFPASFFTVAWPTGEFGGMGLEGAVRLGYRKELEAEIDVSKQKALFDTLVARMYERGKAVNVAQSVEIDAVIDPVESRNWIVRGLKSMKTRPDRDRPRRFIDTW